MNENDVEEIAQPSIKRKKETYNSNNNNNDNNNNHNTSSKSQNKKENNNKEKGKEKEKENIISTDKFHFDKSVKDIPYLFPVPSSLKQLLRWLNQRSVEDKATIIQRIRACNHISLAAENREKMKVNEHIYRIHLYYIFSHFALVLIDICYFFFFFFFFFFLDFLSTASRVFLALFQRIWNQIQLKRVEYLKQTSLGIDPTITGTSRFHCPR